MGFFTFLLYLIVFVELLFQQEYSDSEYRATEMVSGIGMILTLILWVCSAFGTLEILFIVYQWLSFGFFTYRHFSFVREWH